jgi:amino acid transporter
LTTTPDGTTGVRFGYSGWPYYWLTAIVVMTALVVLVVALGTALSATLVGVVVAVVLGVLVLWMGWCLITVLRLAPAASSFPPPGWTTAA